MPSAEKILEGLGPGEQGQPIWLYRVHKASDVARDGSLLPTDHQDYQKRWSKKRYFMKSSDEKCSEVIEHILGGFQSWGRLPYVSTSFNPLFALFYAASQFTTGKEWISIINNSDPFPILKLYYPSLPLTEELWSRRLAHHSRAQGSEEGTLPQLVHVPLETKKWFGLADDACEVIAPHVISGDRVLYSLSFRKVVNYLPPFLREPLIEIVTFKGDIEGLPVTDPLNHRYKRDFLPAVELFLLEAGPKGAPKCWRWWLQNLQYQQTYFVLHFLPNLFRSVRASLAFSGVEVIGLLDKLVEEYDGFLANCGRRKPVIIRPPVLEPGAAKL